MGSDYGMKTGSRTRDKRTRVFVFFVAKLRGSGIPTFGARVSASFEVFACPLRYSYVVDSRGHIAEG